MSKLQLQIAELAAQAIKLAMNSGLSWDESIAAFGVASKALALKASSEGDGNAANCTAHAAKRFNQGLDQSVDVQRMHLH